VKEFLSQEGRAFVVRDVEEDDDAYRDLVALGIRSVPVTVIGPHRVNGYDPEALRAALAHLDAR
jgi:glutaredoxin-like protein NrdH